MIIKNIKLENFGGHKSINFDTDGEKVIGLLGANGSGKTTILSAIKYAITGDLEGTIESNIKKGETSGKVSITFIKNGKEGSIERRLGKTSKAQLDWDGREYKAKKDIEKVLQTLVGGDKQALANAVFMGQGSLNKLLFGSETEREQLFVRLNNLSYLQKFSEIIDQRSKVLNEANDLLPTMDALNEQRMDLVSRKEGYEKTLSGMEDLSRIITLMQEKKIAENLIESLEDNKNTTTEKMHEVTNKISEALGDLSREAIEKEAEAVKKAIEAANASKTECKVKMSEYANSLLMKEELRKLEASIEKAEEELKEAGMSGDWSSYVAKEVEDTDKASLLDFEISQLEAWRKAQNTLVTSECSDVCEECGLAKTETGHEDFVIGLDPKNDLESLIAKKVKELASVSKDIEFFKKLQTIKSGQTTLQERHKILLEESSKKFKEWPENPEEEDVKITKLLGDLSVKLSKLESTKNKVATERSALNTLGETWGTILAQLKKQKEHIVSDVFAELDNYDQDASFYEEQQVLYNSVKSKLDETNTLLDSVTKKYSELLDRDEKNTVKKDLHQQLQRLKEAFSKKGIPRAYINSKFDIITELTQKNLDILGTDFFIEPSEDKSLAFDFTRFVDGEKLKLPMSKLSGGQRVRLSLSFILSIQQLVMSEIGFITLDEPSTHLDEEGIDSLGDLLKKIRMIFADSEHQLWVCDHNPKLETSFDKTLILK